MSATATAIVTGHTQREVVKHGISVSILFNLKINGRLIKHNSKTVLFTVKRSAVFKADRHKASHIQQRHAAALKINSL